MNAAEILADLKARDVETPENSKNPGNFGVVVLLDQDRTLQRLTACWANVPVSRDPDPLEYLPPSTPPNARIRWYWARLIPDPIGPWIETSGLPDAPHVRRACQVLIDNRVVHPDGKVSRWAERYLAGLVAGAIPSSPT